MESPDVLIPFANANVSARNEQIQTAYVRILLSIAGITSTKPEEDKGIDLIGIPLPQKMGPGVPDISSTHLDMQLKASRDWRKIRKEQFISYSLDADNYNQMVQRNTRIYPQAPLMLILWCMPQDGKDPVEECDSGLLLKGLNYWYILSPKEKTTTTQKSFTLHIPSTQIVTITSLNYMANYIFRDAWREEGGYDRWFNPCPAPK